MVCVIEAPCKINLHLAIGEKRPDGFHNLESLFAALALSDILRFECGGNDGSCGLSMDWDIAPEKTPGEIPPEKNLILKAVSLFRERSGFSRSLVVSVKKRVPPGAGLGGGSSDAASTLLALNLLAGNVLSDEALLEAAAFLGSDVPFFLGGGAAFVSGRGELIEPVRVPPNLWVVLVKPPVHSDTASAFRILDSGRERGNVQKTRKITPKEGLITAFGGNPASWPFFNDFLPLFLASDTSETGEKAAEPGIYRAILESLRVSGASFTGLSGSGSCCFGVFTARGSAEKAEKELFGQGNYVKLTFFLARRAKAVLE